MYQKVESYLALTTQEPVVGQSYNESQPKDALHMQRQGDCSFINHQVEENYNVNQDFIAHNSRRKRRSIEDATPPPLNQASRLNIIPHVQVVNDQANAPQK